MSSRLFFQDQDLNFKTKTLKFFQDQDQAQCSRPRPGLCISRPRPFRDVYQRPTEKHFSFSAVNENADENEIAFTAENKTKTDIHFRPKNENESHLIIFFFLFIHSVTKSALQCAANISSSFAFFTFWSLLTGFHFPHAQCIDNYLCGIFLDDISTREQFAFLVYCYRVKAIFHVLYWRLCGLTNSSYC